MKKSLAIKKLLLVFSMAVGVALLAAHLVVSADPAKAQNFKVPSAKTENPVIRILIASLQNRENSVQSATGYLLTSTFLNKSNEVMNLAKGDAVALKIQKQSNSLSQLYFAVDGQKSREDQRQLLPTLNSFYELVAYDGERLQRWRYGTSGSIEKEGGSGSR